MKINNKATLNTAILELQKRKLNQEEQLILQFKATSESLTPLNLIKEGFRDISGTPGIKSIFLKSAAGFGTAFLSKILIGGKTSLLKKVLGTATELVVAGATVNQFEKIKAYGIATYHNLFKTKKAASR